MTEVRENSMEEQELDEEPMGIVIALGPQTVDAPRFSAYVWSRVPEPQGTDTLAAA